MEKWGEPQEDRSTFYDVNFIPDLNVNIVITNEMKMWSSQLWLRFKQSQSKPEKCFRGFNRIRTHGLCVSAAVLHQLSYEDSYVGSRPILIGFIVPVRGSMKHMNIMWTADIWMKWRCDRSCDCNLSNRKVALETFFRLTLQLLKSQSQPQWSYLHFIRMSAVHIIFILW